MWTDILDTVPVHWGDKSLDDHFAELAAVASMLVIVGYTVTKNRYSWDRFPSSQEYRPKKNSRIRDRK